MDDDKLKSSELLKIKNHEIIHAKKYHTLDTLFVEIASIVLWFNPLMKYLKSSLQVVHEYIVDEQMTQGHASKKDYTELLLRLVSEVKTNSLLANFSGNQILNRVTMITKVRSLAKSKLWFLLILPLTAFLSFSFSFFEMDIKKSTISTPQNNQTIESGNQNKIGNITWEGNTLYSTDQLNERLGLKRGDEYSKEAVMEQIYMDKTGLDLLYFDKGYVFFKPDIIEKEAENGFIDITISIYEGIRGKIGSVIIKGNEKVSEEDIQNRILVRPGDLFSKTQIVKSVKALEDWGMFIPGSITPTPIPIPDEIIDECAVINLEFKVIEK